MKTDKQVTDVEHILTGSDSIVSKTDLKGMITYVNDAFVHISGYSREELIGTPHNVVRHPDMPPEAFADLWTSMKAARPWTGIVKNRCKNGDYYWVLANAAPIYEHNRLVGYMSVRSKPDREQVKAADAAYRLFRAGKARNLQIQDGKVVKTQLLQPFKLFKDLNIKSRLIAIIGLLSILLAVVGGIGLFGISKAEDGLRNVYEDRTLPISQISAIQKLLLTNRLNIAASLNSPTPETIKKNTADVEQNIEQITRLWDDFRASRLTDQEKILADRFAENRMRFVADGLKPAIAALRANDIGLAARVADRIDGLYLPVGEGIQQLTQLQLDVAKQEFGAARLRHQTIRTLSIGLIAAGITLVIGLGLALIRVIVRPLETAIAHFGQIAQGNYNNIIEIERRDEIGKVMESLKAMQTKLGFDVAEIKRISDENLRVKIALDSICTGVMITDNERNIIYANKSVVDILSKTEADIHEQLPNFTIDNLIGTNIDDLHKKPAHQAQLLSSLTGTYKAGVLLGDRSMVVTANPMVNAQGLRVGTVAEWLDRTTEVAMEQDMSIIVEAAAMGDLSKRLDLQDKKGFILQLGTDMNRLLETSENALNEIARVLGALSRGDLTETITNDYQGTFGRLKEDSNTTVEKLKEIIGVIWHATDNINAGSKEIASGNNNLSQRTERQAASLEETAASMEQLTAAVQQNTKNAKHANRLATDASEIAGRGGVIVGRVAATMDDINEASHKIGDIISVIDDIAFQTNILALNAAIEAARAGEQGRGFAVVAIEVRNLAQRAASAAEDIKRLVGDSVEKVSDGSQLVVQAGQTMQEILSSIRGVTAIMSEITVASIEQNAGIEQVNQAIAQLDDVTQQNAALVEQAAAAAESLEGQAQNLAVTVGGFKIDEQSRHRLKAVNETKAAGTKVPGIRLIGHRGHQEHGILDIIKSHGNHAHHARESIAVTKQNSQRVAVVNGDWEEF
ncbi:methyl-accepting chemotaxis sensory transducer with TarH sensor /methyl-accepting chemotaxis sensory transducer with Pas/Pac sensor [Methylobacter tundripaludum]|uniref:Methyl-accepting chemotaxis sensory transducer with TarH sensor /methyl-accepting chemotaxis sensory transducer with Pas/Pac sensor n=1 Tax=Methylobacter tundripaludum TaxID=173365 RepID=A0A2S6GJI7_9GAMM|nr:methyl-accepting chemotaxis protein [Methylobacter tundripaludum]PPK65316.1 methyl-accepting chemotaxis sensory transducer with TarH sensor /methyl-accepting chemotaxis sensory transducer with Pas/Pac sensor [Methylobacter tundripaludum]